MNNTTQNILSLDIATKTGWALFSDGKITKHGTETFSTEHRTPLLCFWIVNMIRKHNITHIVAEDIFKSEDKETAYKELAKMQGALEIATYLTNIQYTLISPITIKSKIIPSKKYNRERDKQRMINKIQKYGYILESNNADDEADAIGLLITYLSLTGLTITHPREKNGKTKKTNLQKKQTYKKTNSHDCSNGMYPEC